MGLKPWAEPCSHLRALMTLSDPPQMSKLQGPEVSVEGARKLNSGWEPITMERTVGLDPLPD